MVKYSIVIPAKDEGGRIGETIAALKSEFGDEAEIIVVDDGSKDDTSGTAKKLGVNVIRHSVNKGKGAAVKTGFLSASGDVVGFVDADCATDVKDVRKVFELAGDYDLVAASRRIDGAVLPVDQSITRKLLGYVMRMTVQALFGLNVVDTQCGCKAMKKDLARKTASEMKSDGFEFDVEMFHLAKKSGRTIKEVGVRWTDNGESKVNPVTDSIRMLGGLIKLRLNAS